MFAGCTDYTGGAGRGDAYNDSFHRCYRRISGSSAAPAAGHSLSSVVARRGRARGVAMHAGATATPDFKCL